MADFVFLCRRSPRGTTSVSHCNNCTCTHSPPLSFYLIPTKFRVHSWPADQWDEKEKKKNKRENWRTIPGASCFLHIKGGPKPPTGYFKMRKSISYSLEKKGNDDHERDHTAWHALFSFIGKFVDKTENRQANKVSLVDRKRAKGKRGARRKWTDKRRRRWTPTCRRRRNRPATCWRRARRSPGNKRCPKSSSPFSDWDSEDFSSAIDVLIELLLLFSLSCFHTAAQRL